MSGRLLVSQYPLLSVDTMILPTGKYWKCENDNVSMWIHNYETLNQQLNSLYSEIALNTIWILCSPVCCMI